MPCYVESDPEEEKRHIQEVNQLSACLCSALKYMQGRAMLSEFFEYIDEEECNFSAASFLREWWKKHLRQDEIRKQKEVEMKKEEKIKRDALNKLSDEEKKLLGLKWL